MNGRGLLEVLQNNDYLPCGRGIVVRGNIYIEELWVNVEFTWSWRLKQIR